jgi:hypothetical protein
MQDGEITLNSLKEKFSVLAQSSKRSVSHAGVFDTLHSSILEVDEKFNQVDFDELTEEEKKDYYERLINIPDDSLTDEDKARIQKYIDYLEDKFVVDNKLSEEEKWFISLYEKIHSEEMKKINTFFANSSPDNGFTEEEKAEIKYIAYTSNSPYHEIFFECIEYCSVVEFNASYVDEEGNEKTRTIYSTDDRKIHINRNYNDASSFIDDPFGAYNGLFQELGHNFDDLLCNGYEKDTNITGMDAMITGNAEYKEKLYSAMCKDVENEIVNSISRYNNNEAWISIDEKGQEQILDVLMGRTD